MSILYVYAWISQYVLISLPVSLIREASYPVSSRIIIIQQRELQVAARRMMFVNENTSPRILPSRTSFSFFHSKNDLPSHHRVLPALSSRFRDITKYDRGGQPGGVI